MRNRLAILLLLAVAGALASCGSTRVVIADPDQGVERDYSPDGIEGRRSIRLQYDRVKLNDRAIVEPPICYTCVELEPGGKTASFNLMFFAANDTGAQWELRANMFHLRSARGADSTAPPPPSPNRVGSDANPVLASIAPYSTARIPVLFSVQGVNINNPDSRIYGDYELYVFQESVVDPFPAGVRGAAGQPAEASAPGNQVLLERHLAIGRFHQGVQALRFVGFFTVALLVLGTL